MARITVEDCLNRIHSQYDLVLLAKERTSQLNAGDKSLVPGDNDKNTVISLREIGEGKISIKALEDTAITKLRKIQSNPAELEDLEAEQEDDFDKIYRGEISKSGAAILPSKRTRRIPDKLAARTFKAEDEKVKEDTKQADEQSENESLPAENKTE